MKFAAAACLILGLVVVASAADTKKFCDGKSENVLYKDTDSGTGLFGAWSCMKYHECVKGEDIVHHCSFILPLRQYDPKTRSCVWFWNADCHADDA